MLNEEQIAFLESTGCHEIEMGVQELDYTLNKNILRRKIDLEHLKKIIKKIQKTKIIMVVDIMLGLPTQKEKNLIEMINFFNENRINLPMLFWTRYYPKTEIIDIAIKEGALKNEGCDKVDASSSFAIKGSTYNLQFAKIGNLFFLCCLLPKWLVRWMVKKRSYEYFPPALLKFFFHIFCLYPRVNFLWALKRKRRNLYFIHRHHFYFYYLYKWLIIR